MPSPQALTENLKALAERLGFRLVGACPAVDARGFHRLEQWLDAGYAGEMDYLEKRRAAYRRPQEILVGARSLLMLGMPYGSGASTPLAPGSGRIARYARSEGDYHDWIRPLLHELADDLRRQIPQAQVRGVIDTAPLLEREFAELAGLGWIGKNTLLLNRTEGSYFFLAALVTDAVLAYDAPHDADHCGTCRACLDACPTQAFPAPYVLDARKCLSYQTIEHRSPAPGPLREAFSEWVFGCDVCQEVCPWNRRRDEPQLPTAGGPRCESTTCVGDQLPLAELFWLNEAEFRRRFRATPLWRPQRRGVLRNAALVLGAQRDAASVAALAHGLGDPEPLVRGACAWALRQIGGVAATEALARRLAAEQDADVRRELGANA